MNLKNYEFKELRFYIRRKGSDHEKIWSFITKYIQQSHIHQIA